MKLSEAIRLGAMLEPQSFRSHDLNGICALEAAVMAISGRKVWQESSLHWPWIDQCKVSCPEPIDGISDCCYEHPYRKLVYHLNDTHRWPRERTAAWIATVEPQEPLLLEDLTSTHLLEVGQQVDKVMSR
jgi:hypothetical protein